MSLRLSEAEYAQLMGGKQKKKSKYNARKTYVDGICFDSQVEANYYSELKLLQRGGVIDGFCRQPRFVITEGRDDSKCTEYIADFIIFYPDGTYKIVDVKGMETEIFKMKMKCFTEKYPHIKVAIEKR